MARPLWSGSLSFGLVNVPVRLFSAARDLDFHFHQLHEKDKRRIEQRRFCKEGDVEVGWEEIAHSYDLDGKQVVVSDEELGSVEPRKTRTIEIESFADLADVDPIYFDHPYFLVPAGDGGGLPAGLAMDDCSGVAWTGSPLSAYNDDPIVRHQIAFARAAFARVDADGLADALAAGDCTEALAPRPDAPPRLSLRCPGRDRGRLPSTPWSSRLSGEVKFSGPGAPSLRVMPAMLVIAVSAKRKSTEFSFVSFGLPEAEQPTFWT